MGKDIALYLNPHKCQIPDCSSLSIEKSYCRNRGLIWQITFSPSISHLLCNTRIFFIGEEFPFIGSKSENHSYCPRIESKSTWLQHNLHFHVSYFSISTKPAASITNWCQWGWVSSWKSTEQPFHAMLAHILLHKAQHRLHYPHRDCRSQVPRQVFPSAMWPSLDSLLLSRSWPNSP